MLHLSTLFSGKTVKNIMNQTMYWILALFLLSTTSSRAQTGGALNFTNGDYVELPSSFNAVTNGTSDFTLETWFKTSMTEGTLMSKRSVCNVAAFWNIRISAGKIRFEMMESGGANTVDFSTPLTYNNNAWHHVAVTRNGTIVKIFMDGYAVASYTGSGITNLSNIADPIKLGQSACNNFVGELDETRIWTEAQSACEIYANKNYQFNSALSSLKFNAHFNQGTAGGSNASVTSLTNSAANAIAGTLNTFALSGSSSNWVSSTCPAQGLSATAPVVQTTTACGSYVWEGITYPASGTYNRILASVVNGCDSIAQLILTVNTPPAPFISISDNSVCSGSSGNMLVMNANGPTYCTPTTTNNTTNNDYISYFSLNQMQQESGDGPGVYNYYSGKIAYLSAGTFGPFYSYDIDYGNSTSQQYSRLWIDYNQDGDFSDANESVTTASNPLSSSSSIFMIPTTALNGLTRMRVACRRGVTPAANQSCGGYDYGEFEDYNIFISGGQPNPDPNTYSWAPSTFLSSTSTFNPSFTNFTSPTVYTVTLTDANGCSATATQSLSVNPLPATPLISSSSNSICSGSTLNLTNAPGYCTPTVSGTNVAGQHYIANFSLGTSLIVNVTGDGPGVYNYYSNITANVSAGTPYSFVMLQGGSIACSKAIWIDLNQDGDFSDAGEFIVSASASMGAFSGFLAIPPTAYNGITRMRVAVSFASSITSGQSCSGFTFGEYEDYNLNITGGFNATTWAPASPLNTSVGNPVQIINQTSNTTYTVTITDANGCTKTDTQTIGFLASPNVSITASADSVCTGLPVTLTASGAISYSWSPSISNGVAFTPAATTTYTVTGTGANGCTDAATKQVKVLTVPIAPTITGPNSICPGGNVLLTTSNYCTPVNQPGNTFSNPYSITQFIFGSTIVNNTFSYADINNSVILNTVYSNFTDQVAFVTAGSMYGFAIVPEGSQPVYLLAMIDYNQDGVFDVSPGNNEVVNANQVPMNNPQGANILIPATAKNGLTRMRILVSSHNFNPDVSCFNHDPNGSAQVYGEYEDYSIKITGGVNSNLTWSPTQSLIITQGASTIATINSTTTYTVTNTSANGCTASSTKLVTALPTPAVNITPSVPGICLGNSVTLTATGATSYSWSNGVNNGIAFSPTATETYSVVGTNASGCKDTATIEIPVETGISVPDFTSNNVCSGQQSTIDLSTIYCIPTASNNSNGNAYINNFGFNGNAIQNPSGEEPTNYTYFSNLTANVSAGSVNNFTMSIGGTFSTAGIIYVDYNQDGDFDESNELVYFNTSGAFSYSGSFTIPSTAANGITRMRVICASGNSAVNYSCSGLNLAEYEDYNLNISGGLNRYAWSPSGLLVNNIGSKITTVPLTATTTFTVTATSTYGCTATSTRTITVNPLPTVSATSSASGICPGDSVQLGVIPAAPVQNSLVFNSSNEGAINNQGLAFNIIATNQVTITGFKKYFSSATTEVEVWYKAGGYGNTTISGNAGWTKLGSAISITSAGPNALTSVPLSSYIVIPAGQTYGFIIICNGFNYASSGNNLGAIYAGNSDISITQGHWGSGFNGSFSFIYSPSAWHGEIEYTLGVLNQYAWSPSAGLSNANVDNPKASPSTGTVYFVTVTDANGCTGFSGVPVAVNNIPNSIIVNGPNAICNGSSAMLVASGASSYNWQPGNLNGASITVNPVQSTTYTVTASNSSGCTKTATKLVTVNSMPFLTALASTNTICAGTSVNLNLSLKSSVGPSITIVDNAPANPYPAGINVSGLPSSNTHLNRVYINGLSHTWPGDIDMWLKAPNGQIVMLMSDAGNSLDILNSNLIFEDGKPSLPGAAQVTSGSYQPTNYEINGSNEPTNPSTQLSFFNGNMNGLWELYVRDDTQTDFGSISSFQLEFGNSDTTNSSVAWVANPTSNQNSISNPNSFSTTVTPMTSTIYTATVSDAIGCSATTSVSITVNQCNTNLSLKLFIEGYYSGAQSMLPVLMNEGIGSDNTNVDSITVELRNAVSPYSVLVSSQAMLKTDGAALATFPTSVPNGNYYIVIKHRNSIETWSSNAIAISSNTNYDFTTASNKSFGNNMIEVDPGVWALYSGDINQDENVDLLDLSILEADISNFQFGYLATDMNGDGNVDLLDIPIVEANINAFVFSIHP